MYYEFFSVWKRTTTAKHDWPEIEEWQWPSTTRYSSFVICWLFTVYLLYQSLSNWSLSCSYCPTQCSHSLHFILSHSLTISLSYLFVHSIFIILILVWLFDFEYLFLLICLVTKFWPTYSLISIIYPHISLSLLYWLKLFIGLSLQLLHARTITHLFKDKPTGIFPVLF